MNAVFSAALAALDAGLSIIPIGANKKPAVKEWKPYQKALASPAQAEEWFLQQRHTGLGIICGEVSGDLEMLEWESQAIFEAYRDLAAAAGLLPTLDRIVTGYSSKSPGGGIHALYRSDDIAGSTALARRPKRPEEMKDAKDKLKVLIETRGEGGYTVEPPSNGRVHPTGRAYQQLQGGFASIQPITPDERGLLFDLARTFDEMPKAPPRDAIAEPTDRSAPGHDYNHRGDVLSLLKAHDWPTVYERDGVMYLRRPGKDVGVSATFGYGGTRYFYVFSTSTEFEANRAYSPFAVYAMLKHGGDFIAAARALAAQGYGDLAPRIALIEPPSKEVPWPALEETALYGLPGDVVRTIAPHTEGDPVALLVNFLIMFGSAVGPSPHARVGATKHHVNEFAVLVGETARARKGTASNETKRIVVAADPFWSPRVMGGVSSGEGLIHAVRDPIERSENDDETRLVDPGVEDKRLLAIESEFSSVLRRAGREGNTLSEVLRQAWDGEDLRTLTRREPLVATAPHISLLGHITMPELLRELTETYQANGFANRHLFLCVRRSQELPHGGALPDADLAALVRRVGKALAFARSRTVVRRDEETDRVWEVVYSALTADRPGMFGAITARAEAHVLRFSLLYALLELSEAIRRPHLEAALALWQYSEDSDRFIFGDATGDPVADQILRALRQNGRMTQTQLADLFNRNLKPGRLPQALTVLLEARKVRSWEGASDKGRPPIYWEATS